MADPIIHAAESQHFYWPDGRPAYEVPSADGKRMIAPDVRHARKLGLYPGVSSIIRCADRPGLTRYLIDQHMMACLTLPRLDGEGEKEWLARVRQDAAEHADKASTLGTAIHAAIQGGFEGKLAPHEFAPHVAAVRRAVAERWPGMPERWQAEHSYANPLGYGCKIDLIGAAVIDFKTKEFSEAPTPENKVRLHWDEHAMQLAANRRAANANSMPCANIFVSTSVPGLTHVHVWEEDELSRAWGMFKGLYEYWVSKNKYNPRSVNA